MHGRLKIQKINTNGTLVEEIDLGKNAITWRAKSIMSRIIGGGLTGAFDWGDDTDGAGGAANTLAVTGIALGNGGHLIYNQTSGETDQLNKGAGIVLTPSSTESKQNTSADA